MLRINPKYKDVHLEEIPKIIEIRDAFNNLWFKVILKEDPDYEMFIESHYQIKVIAFRVAENPLVIVNRPNPDEKHDKRFLIYEEALKIFNEYVKNYTSLVKAQTRDIQDMDIYAEKVGYKTPERMCCATCQFCRARRLLDYTMNQDLPRLECWNEENQQEYEFDIRDPHKPIHVGHEFHHFLGSVSQTPIKHHQTLDVHPTVDPLGVCDRWVKRVEDSTLYPGQSLQDYIDQRVGKRVDQKIVQKIETGLTGELSAPVVQAVTMVLSSPDASVALSAPVVSIVTTSEEIQKNTIETVGNTLSTNVLSSAMIPAVVSIIPEDQVSSAIVDVASKGIKIEKIIGNDTLKFKDKNKNNIPDEYEDEIIIGGDGAE